MADTYGDDARLIVFTPGSLKPPNATGFFREAAPAVRRVFVSVPSEGTTTRKATRRAHPGAPRYGLTMVTESNTRPSAEWNSNCPTVSFSTRIVP